MQNIYMQGRINSFVDIHTLHTQIICLIHMAIGILEIKVKTLHGSQIGSCTRWQELSRQHNSN